MNTVIEIKNAGFALSHNYLINQIKKLPKVKDGYYNHLFSCFVIDCEDVEIVLTYLKSLNIEAKIKNDFVITEPLNYFKTLILIIILLLQFFLKTPYIWVILAVLINYKIILNSIKILSKKIISDELLIALIMLYAVLFSYNYQIAINSISILLINDLYKLWLTNLKNNVSEKSVEQAETKVTVKKDFKKTVIAAKDIQVNDIICLEKNSIIPVDGTIIKGTTKIDQSTFINQSPIINKDINENIYSGCINIDNYIEYQATETIYNSAYQQRFKQFLIALNTTEFNTFFNNHAGYIFIIVLIINTLLSRFNLMTVLIILSFNTYNLIPSLHQFKKITALYKQKLTFNNYRLLKRFNDTKTLIIEKEGLISNENLEVTDVYICKDISFSDFYHIAYMLIKKINHVAAQSVKIYLQNINLNTLDSSAIKNLTKKRTDFYENHKVINHMELKKNKIDSSEVEKIIADYISSGQKPLIFLKDNKIIGIIVVRDVFKKEALNTIKDLKNLNKEIVLLDNNEEEIAINYLKDLNVNTFHHIKNTKEQLKIINSYDKVNTFLLSVKDLKSEYNKIIFNHELNYNLNNSTILINNEFSAIKEMLYQQDSSTIKHQQILAIALIISSFLNTPSITMIILAMYNIYQFNKILKNLKG